MGHGDFFERFESAAYQRRILSCYEAGIHQRKITKRRPNYGIGFKVGAGTTSATWTSGLSLLASRLELRQVSVAEQKLALIQSMMHDNAYGFHHGTTIAAGAAQSRTVDIVLDDVITADTPIATHHNAAEIVTQAIVHPITLIKEAQQGIKVTGTQLPTLDETGHATKHIALANNITHAIPMGYPNTMVGGMVIGYEVGTAAVHNGAAAVTSLAVQYGAHQAIRLKDELKDKRQAVVVVSEIEEDESLRSEVCDSKTAPAPPTAAEVHLLSLCAEFKGIQDQKAKLGLKGPGCEAPVTATKPPHGVLATECEWVESNRHIFEDNAIRFRNLSNQMQHNNDMHTPKSFQKLEKFLQNMQYCLRSWSANTNWEAVLQRAQTALDARIALSSSLDKCEARHQTSADKHQSRGHRARDLAQRNAQAARISTKKIERRPKGGPVSNSFYGRVECHEARKWETRAQMKFEHMCKMQKIAQAEKYWGGEAVLAWVESVERLEAMETPRTRHLDAWASRLCNVN